MRKKMFIIIATVLTVATVKAEIYHEECKEDLREIMRQGTNYEKLGLTFADTLSWYENEDWVAKLVNYDLEGNPIGVNWIETEDKQRIYDIYWHPTIFPTDPPTYQPLGLEGKIKFRSPVLLYLNCGFNETITEVDVSENLELIFLSCGGNSLTELDISNNKNLLWLLCHANNLTELNINHLTKLHTLYCGENYFSELDLSNNIELEILSCVMGNLTALDLSQNVKLRVLTCYENYLRFSTFSLLTFNNNDPDRPHPNLEYIHCNPQKFIDLGEREYTDTIDLSSEYIVKDLYDNEYITGYFWHIITDEGEEIPIYGTPYDPVNENGVFTFNEFHKNKKLRCYLTNIISFLNLIVFEVTLVDVKSIEGETEILFAVSPNPATDKLTIHHSKELGNILLYDLSGRLLRTYSISETVTVIDILDLDIGVYFLTVDGKSMKFIKE